MRAKKRPVLQVAHHRLEGKPVRLETPLAILETPLPARDEATDDYSVKKIKTEKEMAATRTEIKIKALVWDKLVFSKRPEPIIQLSSDV